MMHMHAYIIKDEDKGEILDEGLKEFQYALC